VIRSRALLLIPVLAVFASLGATQSLRANTLSPGDTGITPDVFGTSDLTYVSNLLLVLIQRGYYSGDTSGNIYRGSL
jgi:hypothetical protein